MARSQYLHSTLLAGSVLAVVAGHTYAAGRITTLTAPGTNGGYNWCMDERGQVDGGKLVTGWITTDGRVQATQYDLTTATQTTANLDTNFEIDDHDNPAFYKTSDGRYTAFWSEHNTGTYVHYKTSTSPGDISSWGAKTDIATNIGSGFGSTYPTVNRLPGGTENQVFAHWRGANWKPTYSIGTYTPSTKTWSWQSAANYVDDLHMTDNTIRPYVQMTGNSNKLGVIFTDGHPRDFGARNNLYYFEIKPDTTAPGSPLTYYKANGVAIKNTDGSSRRLSDGPVLKTAVDIVYGRDDGNTANGNNSWGWDVAYDAQQRPVVAYASFVPDPAHPSEQAFDTHQYHYSRWDGTQWRDTTLVPDAGGSIADTSIGNHEYQYSGGICVDPVDPNIVYLSRKVNGQFEIEQWKTKDAGLTWTTLTITATLGLEDVRPYVPANRPANMEMVEWMSGDYTYWAKTAGKGSFDTNVMLWTNPVPEPGVAILTIAGATVLLRRRTRPS